MVLIEEFHEPEEGECERFVCRICGILIALSQNQTLGTAIFQRVFNVESSVITERLSEYYGTAISCKNCRCYLGYKITKVINQQRFDLVGSFDLDMSNIQSLFWYRYPVRYKMDSNFFVCRNCKNHVALTSEFLNLMLNMPDYGVFSELVCNVHCSIPYLERNERRFAVRCSACYTGLGYKIDAPRGSYILDLYPRHLIQFRESEKYYFCATCETHIALVKDLLKIRVPPLKLQVQRQRTYLFKHVVNSEWSSIKVMRPEYEGTSVICKNCRCCLGYRITKVIDQRNLHLVVGIFNLTLLLLNKILPNGRFDYHPPNRLFTN